MTGWVQDDGELVTIEDMNESGSPRFQIRVVRVEGVETEIYRPDGRKFLTMLELEQRAQVAEAQAQAADTKAQAIEERLVRVIAIASVNCNKSDGYLSYMQRFSLRYK